MYDIFESLVAQGKVKRTRLLNLRLKLHVPCQWTCNFCHMEGNASSQPIRNDSHFAEVLTNFRDRFGFTEVHFTGGEPSIHPEIVDFISKARGLGFEVKMTTNGQAKLRRYLDCIEAGLDELNISIHTLDPAELGKLMIPPRHANWGRKAIKQQLALLDALAGKVGLKINTCVGEADEPALAIAAYIRNRGVSWRLMNVLETSEVSYASLRRVRNALEAEPVQACIIDGSSSCSVDMLCKDGFAFKLKLIRPHFLDAMCAGCELRKHEGCYEFAYGRRLEMEKGLLMVRNCIHREGPPFSLPVHAYFSHPLAQQLRDEL